MAKQYQHVHGTIYLVTYTFYSGEDNCPANDAAMPDTIDGAIHLVDCAQDYVVDCKIRAIHDKDGTVRDVTEDIAQIMVDGEDFWGGYRPDWVDYPSFKIDAAALLEV
jgi:hypothetical protein